MAIERLTIDSDLSASAVEDALTKLSYGGLIRELKCVLVVPEESAFQAGRVAAEFPNLTVSIVPNAMLSDLDAWCVTSYPGNGVWSPGA